MSRYWGWVVLFLVIRSSAPAWGAPVSSQEHSRRIARMKALADSSNGKIEVTVIPEAPDSMNQDSTNGGENGETARSTMDDALTWAPEFHAQLSAADRALFAQALHLYYDGCYRQALDKMQHDSSGWVEKGIAGFANYWCGECWLAMGDIKQAVECWHKAVNSADCIKADQALLRLAQQEYRQGKREAACALLRKLINDLPASDGAAVARRWVEWIEAD
ncbi:MAG TPA: tetratricopeptide repeat protein [bacterium]|nr:tetratricopeptide repeat protein [bacterium]HPN32903.1 tetratricopeptide repeat protein [bacterium]